MRDCPNCASPLRPRTLSYTLDPTPDAIFICQGRCKTRFALYTKGQDEILVSFAESPAEDWDAFVARKWEEYYEERKT